MKTASQLILRKVAGGTHVVIIRDGQPVEDMTIRHTPGGQSSGMIARGLWKVATGQLEDQWSDLDLLNIERIQEMLRNPEVPGLLVIDLEE